MYVLKAETKNEGVVYYMNIICITRQIECAKKFATETEAEKIVLLFKNLFHYEEPKIEIIEVEG